MKSAFFMDGQFEIHCEWGLPDLQHLAPVSHAVIIVDVMSFTTCVEIAASRGATVYPVDDDPDRIRDLALCVNGVVAGARHSANYSLSPASLVEIPTGTQLILPSMNGARLSSEPTSCPIFAGCLRNCRAVAHAVQHTGKHVTVIAAGERWNDDQSIRFALEDYLGAGAIIQHLTGRKSPEARAAAASFAQHARNLAEALSHCTSGQELCTMGFAHDLALIRQVDVSNTVPRLSESCFQHVPS